MTDVQIEQYNKPLFIAELSGNHSGCINKAKNLIHEAKLAGADFVKIQTYKPSTISVKSDRSEFRISEDDSPWKGRLMWDVYEEAHTPWEWHKELFEYSKSIDITLFSTPFDITAVELLEDCNCPIYKVSSFEITELEILKAIGKTNKPVILSTGMADLSEISKAVETLESFGSQEIILLKCTSSYPAPLEDANLRTISHLNKLFNLPCGLSDHCNDFSVSLAAIALGAPLIEKHFRDIGDHVSIDAPFSLDKIQLRDLISRCNNIYKTLGKPIYGGGASDKRFRKDRRSLYIIKDVKRGEKVDRENVRSIRPANGLPIEMMEYIIGKRFIRDAKKGEPLEFNHLMES